MHQDLEIRTTTFRNHQNILGHLQQCSKVVRTSSESSELIKSFLKIRVIWI